MIGLLGGKIQIVPGREASVRGFSDLTDLNIPAHGLDIGVSVSSLIDAKQGELVVSEKVSDLVLLVLRPTDLSLESKAVW